MSTTYRRIAAVETAAKILEFLAHQRDPVTGQEVARAVDVPHATVMCHLVTLEDVRFIRRVGDGYELGMQLSLFWARKQSRLQAQRDLIDRHLEAIAIGGE
jgi:DNA-binding IclR family transcriptional regulator